MKKHWMPFELTSNLFELIKSSKGEWIRPMNCREGEKKTGRSSDKHIETKIDRQSHTHIYTYKDDGY